MKLSDYQYDLFFSYKRHDETLEWTRRFQKKLKLFLSEAIERQADFFVDEETIELGDRWPEKLKDGLRFSRCMVCLWSPLYFRSSWCLSEWQSFRAREERLQLSSHGLIIPIRFNDGKNFPAEARDIQDLDLRKYASTLDAFWSSQRALELEDKIKELAEAVASRIRTAPAFEADWPIVERVAVPQAPIPLPRL